MKILRFLFQDFWRKLVALIFAVVIYWQVGNSIRQKEVRREKPTAEKTNVQLHIESVEQRNMSFTVRMLDSGTGRRRAKFASAAPTVTAELRGTKAELSGIRDGEDLVFYVEIAEDLKPGARKLPVRYHIRRPGIEVLSVKAEEINVTVEPVE